MRTICFLKFVTRNQNLKKSSFKGLGGTLCLIEMMRLPLNPVFALQHNRHYVIKPQAVYSPYALDARSQLR